eukprot:757885-Hanusia_phi.AAC.2
MDGQQNEDATDGEGKARVVEDGTNQYESTSNNGEGTIELGGEDEAAVHDEDEDEDEDEVDDEHEHEGGEEGGDADGDGDDDHDDDNDEVGEGESESDGVEVNEEEELSEEEDGADSGWETSDDENKDGAQNDPSRTRGCSHYSRGCQLVSPCCQKVFWCRFCHDEASDHAIDRHAVKEVKCVVCGLVQPVGPVCVGEGCDNAFGKYFCSICNFFDDNISGEPFHCNGCGICRKGGRENFFHCDTCGCCYSNALRDNHSLGCDHLPTFRFSAAAMPFTQPASSLC